MSVTVFYDRCNLDLIDPKGSFTNVEGDNENRLISIKIDNKINIVSLKWRGIVNGIPCIGCELKNKLDYGTNGTFAGQKLFDCADKKGVLIILNGNVECCVNGNHTDIVNLRYDTIDKDKICCVISLPTLNKHSKFAIGVKIKKFFKNEHKTGIVRWIGLVNDVEAVGAEMDSPQKHGTGGSFNGFNLFKCQGKHGLLFKADDVTLV